MTAFALAIFFKLIEKGIYDLLYNLDLAPLPGAIN